jgi:hypothetical protein
MLRTRVISVLAVFVMVVIGLIEVRSYEVGYVSSRYIAVYSSWTENFSSTEFKTVQGEIDRFQDNESGSEITGWVSGEVDEVFIIGGDLQNSLIGRTLILPSPDVAQKLGDDNLYYSGFEIILDGIKVNEINCVVAAGANGYQVLFSDSLCADLLG